MTKPETDQEPVETLPAPDHLLVEAEELLEFDRVREMLASEARFYMSREIVHDSRPSRHPSRRCSTPASRNCGSS